MLDEGVTILQGNLMHCTTRGNITHNFLRLKEGVVYSVKNFTVLPNKDEFHVMRYADFMLEVDGDTTVQKSFVMFDGFTRYTFQLVEIDALEPTNNKYLIDVVGYVTNIGRTTQTKTGSKTLDFCLANCRGQKIRVTLWGGLDDMLIEKRTHHVGLYPVVITAISEALQYTSSTLIVDGEKIPVLKRLKTNDSGVELTKEIMPADNTAPKHGTLENLLMWVRNRKYDSATFLCQVKIDDAVVVGLLQEVLQLPRQST
ncbi:reverse transcriptase domain-containing protein [Tanacetum coccineum]|uniref:Reverse transcriptase domain-containing protein n=1 Tax=Tanacetum coccineum TaxID=301880 RepID=A0ABQ5FBZ0_9ASTR